MGDTDRDELQALTRVAELKDKIRQATELIGELREKNYSLGGELAELKRELESRPQRGPEASAAGDTPVAASESTHTKAQVEAAAAVAAELEALRKQRQTIRKKVALLIQRIEKLET